MYQNEYSNFLESKEYQELQKHKNDNNYNELYNKAYKKFSYPNFFEFFLPKYKLYQLIIILVLSLIIYIIILFLLEKYKYNKRKSIKKWNPEDRSAQNDILNSGPADVLYEWKRVNKSIEQKDSEENKTISLKVHEIRKDYRYKKTKNNNDKGSSSNNNDSNDDNENGNSSNNENNRNNTNYTNTLENLDNSKTNDERIYTNSKNGKQFKRVIDDLTFGVNYGECLGLLGPNGAGKTTTLSIISCIINPSVGEIIYGNDYSYDKSLFDIGIGICPQFDSLWSALTIREHIEFYYTMCGYSKENVNEIISSLVDYCGIENHINKKVCEVSGGTRRKLSLILSLCSSPSYLLLDEPTAGIDPFTRRYIWNLIKEFKQIKQTATILTTHSTEEAEYLCDRIAIIMKGKLACIDTPKNIKMNFNNYYILEVFTQNADFFENKIVIENNLFGLEDTKNYHLKSYINYQKYTVEILHKNISHIFQQLEKAKEEKIIKEYSFGQCSLEQVYINIINNNNIKT